MSRSFLYGLAAACAALMTLPGLAQDAPPVSDKPAPDWLTWGYDQQRTGWNRGETVLNTANVSKLRLKWTTQLGTAVRDVVLSTLTAPLVVAGVETAQGRKNMVIELGSDDTLFAVDADTGQLVWQKAFPNTLSPRLGAVWECPNSANSTPVIDKKKGLVYFLTSDGKLRGASLSDGEPRLTPLDAEPAFSRSWSLNLIDNVVYAMAARGCGGAKGGDITAGNVAAIDVSDPGRPKLARFYTGHAKPAGPWGRGGVVKGPRGIYTQTADGNSDLGGGTYGEAVLALAPQLTLMDSYTPANWQELNSHDLDLGSASPVIFHFADRDLVVTGAKESVIYALNANNLGGGPPDHNKPLYQTPRIANDDLVYNGHGIWGGFSTFENAKGDRFVYAPIWGPLSKTPPQFKYSYGDAPHGSVVAFQVVTTAGDGVALNPIWVSRDIVIPDVPAVANGVVFAIQTGEQTIQNPNGKGPKPENDILSRFRSTPVSHEILFAFDAETGKQLYSSGDVLKNWTHFSEPVIALGKVFVVSHDAHLFAFGLPR